MIEKALNKYFRKLMKDNDEETNYVIASDTDSVYINLSKLVYKVYNEGEPLSKDQRVRHSRLRLLSFLTEWVQRRLNLLLISAIKTLLLI